MTYEKKSVIELREIAKERKIKGISTLKKQELIKVLENYDQRRKSTWDSGSYARRVWFHPM